MGNNQSKQGSSGRDAASSREKERYRTRKREIQKQREREKEKQEWEYITFDQSESYSIKGFSG